MKTQMIYQVAERQTNEKTINHVGKILGFVNSQKDVHELDPVSISGQIKRDAKANSNNNKNEKQMSKKIAKREISWQFQVSGNVNSHIKNFQLQSQKLQWCGIGFNLQTIKLIQFHIRQISIQHKATQIKFWGIIRGTEKDYYIIQVRKQPYKSNDNLSVGSQKNGQGVNYYSYFVINNLHDQKWTQLPNIEPKHINIARKIKKQFTGNLQNSIQSFPPFEGKQKHYLKAQLCRITHSLQLSPKGIYKVHDENPKVIQYEEQVKIPDFAELNSLEGWVHKNQAILNLGRCTHFVDPKTPEQQIEAKMNQLAQKDPQIQRLKGINQDKVPEQLGLGIQNPWILKLAGNSQIFTKDDANLVYGVVVLRNIYWSGWTTIGFKNGYCNIYIGNGLKSIQSTLSIYQNPDLQIQPQDVKQVQEPNPKELPKQQPPAEEEPKPQDQ